MVNSSEFTNRIQQILDEYHISASAFADSIGVQRSSISHILSGRNKPSLDLVLKIINQYPDVNLYWLLNGKGSFPPSEKNTVQKQIEVPKPEPTIESEAYDLFSEKEEQKKIDENISIPPVVTSNTKNVDRILVMYTDGTFDTYLPNK